jgi:hypothetical protein
MRDYRVMLRRSAMIFAVMLLVLTLHGLLLSFLGGGGPWKESFLIWNSLQAAQVALLAFFMERALQDDQATQDGQAAQDRQRAKSLGKP